MRILLTAFVLQGLSMTVSAATFVYVSQAPEQKIRIYKLDAAKGELQESGECPVEGSPGSLAVDPTKKTLFASLRSNSTLASFRIDPASGGLKLLSSATLGKDENAAFVGTDRTGRWLVSASYSAGKVVVHRVTDEGKIESPAVETVVTAKTAHSMTTDPGNRFVFVPHVAPNAVFQFALNPESGKLTDRGRADGGKLKAGPRHIAFHPRLNLAFTSDESGSSITAYQFDPNSGLRPVQTLSTLPDGFQGSNSTAEVKVHPTGKYVWVSNRGHDSLAGFSIAEDGQLTAISQTPTEKTPRSFEVDPSGKFVFGAGEGSGKLAMYEVEAKSGKLTRTKTYDVGKSLSWVMAVELAD